MPHFYGPDTLLSMISGPGAHLIDDDLRDRMIVKAKEVLTRLEGVRKSLELPPEALGLVCATYGNLVGTEVAKIQHAKAKVLRKKQRDYMAKVAAERPTSSFDSGYTGVSPLMGGVGMYDELDDDEA